MTEVHAGFKHLAHGDLRHCILSLAMGCRASVRRGNPGLNLHVSSVGDRIFTMQHPDNGIDTCADLGRMPGGLGKCSRCPHFALAAGSPIGCAKPYNYSLPGRFGTSRPILITEITMHVTIKTPQQMEKMRIAGKLAAEVLEMIAPHVKA